MVSVLIVRLWLLVVGNNNAEVWYDDRIGQGCVDSSTSEGHNVPGNENMFHSCRSVCAIINSSSALFYVPESLLWSMIASWFVTLNIESIMKNKWLDVSVVKNWSILITIEVCVEYCHIFIKSKQLLDHFFNQILLFSNRVI